jgi:hypothetical protein
VIFRAERGAFPVTWASHLAITDESGGRFLYAQRAEIGPQADLTRPGGPAFDLAIGGASDVTGGTPPAAASGTPSAVTGATPTPWRMTGGDGRDQLVAAFSPAEATAAGAGAGGAAGGETGPALDLRLTATKPPALHDTDGWIDFGSGGSSYYYSRTSMRATGSLTIDGRTVPAEGSAWFDHQWGDFITVGGGGWDWFAINLDDGRDVTLSLVRNADGSYPLVYGTLVGRDGRAVHLPRDAFQVTVTRRWVSPTTGAEYPAGWEITVPGEQLRIQLIPTVAGQELDTRATSGVVYWEGSQVVRWSSTAGGGDQRTGGGEAYVELTGYARSGAVTP